MIRRLIRQIFFRRVTRTITIQGGTMRLVALRGREVIHWAVVHGDEAEQVAANTGGEDGGLAELHGGEAEQVAANTGGEDAGLAVVHGGEAEQVAANTGGEDAGLAVVHGGEAEQVAANICSAAAAGHDATSLRGFLGEGRFRSGRLVTGLPLYAPVSRLLELPRINRRYMDDMVVSQLLETIPFTANEADIAWKRRVNGHDQEVFATAVAKEVIDNHAGVLREAGLLPEAVYSKATALAWAAGVPDVAVVHVEGLQVDIVLVLDSVPQLVHQVELPAQDADSLEQAQVVSMAVEQVISYGLPPGEEGEDRRLLPVMLTGKPSNAGLTPELVGRTLGRELLPLAAPENNPEGFSPDEYSVNLGLALADQAGRKRARKAPPNSVPTVNLLPDRHVSHPRRVARFGVFLAILLYGFLAFQLSGRVSAMESNSRLLSPYVDRLQVHVNERRAVEEQSQDVRARTETVMQLVSDRETYMTNLRGSKGTLVLQMLTMTEEALPAGVSLSELALLDSGFVVKGSTNDYPGIFEFKENVQASGIFDDVRLTSIQGLTQNLVDFELVATGSMDGEVRAPP